MAEQFSGKVEIKNASDKTTIELDGDTGNITVTSARGQEVFLITGNDGDLSFERKPVEE